MRDPQLLQYFTPQVLLFLVSIKLSYLSKKKLLRHEKDIQHLEPDYIEREKKKKMLKKASCIFSKLNRFTIKNPIQRIDEDDTFIDPGRWLSGRYEAGSNPSWPVRFTSLI